MPDITMCLNRECSMRRTCFRYRAKPNEYRQSCYEFKQDENGNCDSYSDIIGYPEYKLRPLDEMDLK